MAVGVDQKRITALHPRVAATLSLILAVGFLAGWTPSPSFALALAVGAVVVGMPHGALDVAIGPKLLDWKVFFPLYGMAVATTIAIWFAAPRWSLVAFLALSWMHFGSGDMGDFNMDRLVRLARGAATGGLVIGLPLAVHPDVVVPIFDTLLLGRDTFTADDARLWGLVICGIAGPAAIATIAAHLLKRQWVGALEIAVIALLGVVGSPLVAFSAYFALWHSPRHLIAVAPNRRQAFPTLAATIGTLIAAVVVWSIYKPLMDTAVQVVFIGLAALTVPHLVVTAAFSRHRRSSPPVVHMIRGLTIHRLRPVR